MCLRVFWSHRNWIYVWLKAAERVWATEPRPSTKAKSDHNLCLISLCVFKCCSWGSNLNKYDMFQRNRSIIIHFLDFLQIYTVVTHSCCRFCEMPILTPWVIFKYLKSMWIFHFCYDFYVNWYINACYHFNWHNGIMRSYSVELKVTRHWIMNVLVFSIRDSLCVSFCLWCMCVSTCMWILIETRSRQQMSSSIPLCLSPELDTLSFG